MYLWPEIIEISKFFLLLRDPLFVPVGDDITHVENAYAT